MSFLHLSSNMCWFGSDVCFYNIAMIIVSRKSCQCQCICSLCNWELFILPLVTLVFIVIVYSYLLSWIQSPFLISALTMFSSLQKIQFCWKFICNLNGFNCMNKYRLCSRNWIHYALRNGVEPDVIRYLGKLFRSP